MCCCFNSGRGRGGPKYCLSWFLLTMIFSIIVVALTATIESSFGGPIPTYDYAVGSRLIYVSNIISFCFSIYCIVIIVRVIENLIFGIVGLVGLLLALFMSFYCLSALAHVPTSAEMSPYVRTYYADNKVAPPFLEYVQKLLSTNSIPIWACCGGGSFEDYADSTKHWVHNASNLVNNASNTTTGFVNRGYFTFTAPDSCCKIAHIRPNCGKDLTFYLHKIDFLIIDETLKRIKSDNEFDIVFEQIIEEKKVLEDQNDKKSTEDLTIVPGSENPEDQKKEHSEHENLHKIHDYDLRRNDDVKIHTLGCGRIIDELKSGEIEQEVLKGFKDSIQTLLNCILAFAIIKVIMNMAVIGIYVCYFYRFNRPSRGVQPHAEYPGPHPGAFEGMMSLSEGIGHPRIETPSKTSAQAVHENENMSSSIGGGTNPSQPPVTNN